MSTLLDSAGRRRSPATMPGYRAGWSPRNKGRVYPADPPRVEEIIAVMRAAGENIHGARVRALVVILWRAGLRINEALTLAETDLEPKRGSILVRHGKGGKRREVGMDDWGGSRLSRGSATASSCRSARSYASLTVRPAGGSGHRPAPAASCGGSPLRRACDGGSLRINCGTRTRSRWRARVCRCPSSSASSGTRTSASRAPTCKESTRPRSSTPCIAAGHL